MIRERDIFKIKKTP